MKLLLLVTLIGSVALACERSENTLAWIDYTALSWGLDSHLFQSLIAQESNYCLDALGPMTRHGRAVGLGQLLPGTAAGIRIGGQAIDPYNPVHNLWGSAYYLREQYLRFDSWELALAAYNAGPTRVARCNCVPNIEETQTYVKEVLARYASLKKAR